jgi:WD40 repeat protein
MSTQAPDSNPSSNPYIGPHPFQPEQRHLFFGREREASELLALVIANRVVLFFAQSGAGKTSLLNARLVPELLGKKFEVPPVGRVSGEKPDSLDVANIFVFNLMAYLNQGSFDDAALAQLPLSDFLVHLAHAGDKWIYQKAADAVEAVAAAGGLEHGGDEVAVADDLEIQPRLLIIDQFEEILTAHPEAWEQRTDFFVQIRQALEEDPYLWVLFAMREDFVGALSPYAHLLPDSLRVRYHMLPMDEKAALAAVKQPAALYGHEFAPGVAELLIRNLRQIEDQEPQLSHAAVPAAAREQHGTGQVAGQTSEAVRLGQFVEPVQLQVVCRQLWDSIATPPGTPITMGDLEKLAGGAGPEEFVNDALRVYYEQSLDFALQRAPEGIGERALRNWFDQVVITKDGKRNLIHQTEGDTDGMPSQVVAALVDRFILRRETRGDRRWVELAHDRFVEPIRRANRQWFAREPSPTRGWAELWLSSGKDPTLLLTGDKLVETAARLKAHPKEFQPLEQEFIATSEEVARKKAEQRRRALLAALTASVVALLSIVAIIFLMWFNERESRRQAVASADAAETAEAVAISAKATAESAKMAADSALALEAVARATAEAALSVSRGRERWLLADGLATKSANVLDQPQVALLLAAEASKFQRAAGEEVAPAVEQALHRVLGATGGTVIPLTGAGADPYAAALGDDGRLAVEAEPGVVHVWNPEDPNSVPLMLPGHEGVVQALAFTPDGETLVSLDDAGTLRVWDLTAAAPAATVLNQEGEVVWTMALLTDTLASTDVDGRVRIHNLKQGEQSLCEWEDPAGLATLAVFSRDGRYLVTAGNDYDQGNVRLWDLAAALPLCGPISATASATGAPLGSLAASPATDQVAVSRDDGTITLYDLPALGGGTVLRGPEAQATSLAFLPNAGGLRLAATYAGDNRILLWDLAHPEIEPAVLRGHAGEIRQLVADPQNLMVTVGAGVPGAGGELRVWDSRNLTYEPQTLVAGLKPVVNMALAPGGDLVAVVSDGDPRAQLVDLTGERSPKPVGDEAEGYATAAAFARDDMLLVSTVEGVLSAWDVANDAPLWTQAAHAARINDIAVHGEQGRAATASEDGSVRIWDVQDGSELDALAPATPTLLTDVAFSPDGGMVAAAGPDGAVHLWNVVGGEELSPLVAGEPPAAGAIAGGDTGPLNFTSLAFSVDGSRLAAAREDGRIWIWDLDTRTAVATPPTAKPVNALAYDRRHVIAAHDDGTISLWYVDTMDTPPQQLGGHTGRVSDLIVERDGAYLLSAGDDGSIQRWTLGLDVLVETACRGAGRSLTPEERKLYLPGQIAGPGAPDVCAGAAGP